jgi:hypothetical protein
MANFITKKKKTHPIYVLGLPRKALFDLYNLLPPEIQNDESLLHSVFGKPPYTFADPERVGTAAPRREFGVVEASMKSRMNTYKSLPEEMREYIVDHFPNHALGFYKDKHGRFYKQEYDEKWTVLCTSTVRSKSNQENPFPSIDDELEIQHIHDPNQSLNVIVIDIGDFKKSSASIYLRS